jgi:RNA polymerase sigma factor (TIGR02999 family)
MKQIPDEVATTSSRPALETFGSDAVLRMARSYPKAARGPAQLARLAVPRSSRVQWQNRGHFFAVAARCMRRILVDAARARQSLKRGGDQTRVDLDGLLAFADAPNIDLVALDQALNGLANVDARRGQVVELRFFAGLSVEETAEVLEVSAETVMRDWKVARAWLFSQLNPTAPAP